LNSSKMVMGKKREHEFKIEEPLIRMQIAHLNRQHRTRRSRWQTRRLKLVKSKTIY